MSGIRTLQDLMDRCRVDEDTGCWSWGQGRCQQGRPAPWLPAAASRVSLGVVASYLRTGKGPAKGVIWHPMCGSKECANPAHRHPGTRSTAMLAAQIGCPPMKRARLAATKRAASRLSEAVIESIRLSTEPLKVLSERFGVSMSHCSRIRMGTSRAPLLAPGASVFSFRPK